MNSRAEESSQSGFSIFDERHELRKTGRGFYQTATLKVSYLLGFSYNCKLPFRGVLRERQTSSSLMVRDSTPLAASITIWAASTAVSSSMLVLGLLDLGVTTTGIGVLFAVLVLLSAILVQTAPAPKKRPNSHEQQEVGR